MSELPSPLLNGENKNEIYAKFNQLLEYVGNMRISGDNRTAAVQRTPNGYVISALPRAGTCLTDDGAAPAAVASGYDGMFAVTADISETACRLMVKGGIVENDFIRMSLPDFRPLDLTPPEIMDAVQYQYVVMTVTGQSATVAVLQELPEETDLTRQICLATLEWQYGVCSVIQNQYGIARLWRPRMGWGLFDASFTADGKIRIGAGYAWQNGEVVPVKETELAAAQGYVCVCAEFGSDGWTAPYLKIKEEPDEKSFPIALVRNNLIFNFGVSLAILTAVAVCPIAAGSGDDNG